MSRKWKFSNGSQYADWMDSECLDCKHYIQDADPGKGCPIEEKVGLAYFLGNEVEVPEELIETGNYHPYRCSKKEV